MTVDPQELLDRRKAFLQRLEAANKANQESKVIHLADKGLQQAELAPIYPDILYLRGSAQRRLGPAWGGAALSSFREGLRLAKKQALKMRFLVALAHFYTLQCDWPALEREVLPTFLKLKESPNKQVQHQVIWAFFYMGCCLDNHFRYQEARIAYEEALQRVRAFKGGHSALPFILHNLGGAFLYGGDPAGALVWIEAAEPLQLDDGYRESRYAEYYLAIGDLSTAGEWITRTLDHPNAKKDHGLQANGRYVWAQLRRRKGDLAGAREQAHIALELAYRAVDYPLIQQITTLLRDLEGPQPGSDPIS
ncbi:MAG TPA: hypothetical protein VK191_03090 [Symbiobacteriaceae bacterium]|nr:hypothetical protein [Symbiobacteriaceae bacterium]